LAAAAKGDSLGDVGFIDWICLGIYICFVIVEIAMRNRESRKGETGHEAHVHIGDA